MADNFNNHEAEVEAFYREFDERERQQEEAEAAHWEAMLKEFEPFDEDASTHAQAELWVDMMLTGRGA